MRRTQEQGEAPDQADGAREALKAFKRKLEAARVTATVLQNVALRAVAGELESRLLTSQPEGASMHAFDWARDSRCAGELKSWHYSIVRGASKAKGGSSC